MAKYSSDSDTEKGYSRYRRRHGKRSSSLDSSDSSPSYQKRSKYKKSKRKNYSPSRSRDRDKASRSHNKHSSSSNSREKYRHRNKSRSSSSEKNRFSKRSSSREKSSSRSSSSQSNAKFSNVDKTNNLLSADKINTSVLEDINKDEFIPKSFTSSAKNKESKFKNNLGDMDISKSLNTANQNSIFHTSILSNREERVDRWIKKLYALRQKAMNE